MALGAGLEIAKSALSATSRQTEAVTRNVAEASNPDASRRIIRTVSDPLSGVITADVVRVTDEALLSRVLSTTSQAGKEEAAASVLTELNSIAGTGLDGTSPSALLADFSARLITYASAPEDDVSASSAISSASRLAVGLNTAAVDVQEAREAADYRIATGVDTLNSLLVEFGDVNSAIVSGTTSGLDLADLGDRRDSILKSIAGEVSIQAVTGPDNGVAIFLSSGLTLFDRSPRTVSFEPTAVLPSGVSGGAVYVDGVPISGSSVTGAIAGALEVRDGEALTYALQLDEMARALITHFAETDQSDPPVQPDRPGLFTVDSLTEVPTEADAVGLAASLRVNATIDPAAGGDPSRLRDGGATGPDDASYVANAAGLAGYSDRLRGLVDTFDLQRSVNGSAGLGETLSITEIFDKSSGWVAVTYQSATQSTEASQVSQARASEALSAKVGVNLDQELTHLLDLERSYEAAARMMTAIDGMYDDLFRMVGS